jgi:ABC-type Fe3+/spermidine/putrescine transport system ATPase subunit
MASRPNGGDIAVQLDRVTKRFGKTTALDDVSLLVRRGELMTLLGPSGCGKTTLLNLVAGFLTPDGGEIAIDGRRVTDVPPYRRESGIMFQQYALFPHMSVAANVGYGLKMRRIARPEIARRVAEASLANSPAGSSSASRWRAPSSSAPRCYCSTSRSPPSTGTCGRQCRSRSRRFSASSA